MFWVWDLNFYSGILFLKISNIQQKLWITKPRPLTLSPFQVNRGDIEGEVLIFGSPDVQQKAKEMIDELLAKANCWNLNGLISAHHPSLESGFDLNLIPLQAELKMTLMCLRWWEGRARGCGKTTQEGRIWNKGEKCVVVSGVGESREEIGSSSHRLGRNPQGEGWVRRAQVEGWVSGVHQL